jgi:hypothetical protein
MDLQFYGANCIAFSHKGTRIVVDDTMVDLGAKAVIKSGDVALFTTVHAAETPARLVLDGPGEYEVADISIVGLSARAHIDGPGEKHATMFKLVTGDQSILVTGHIYPELSEAQLEAIGVVDVLIVPVGGSGYTLDPVGALKLIKDIEPKLVIPTHYDDSALHYPVPQLALEPALKELGMEPKETTGKLRLKSAELSEVTQLIVLERN